MWQVIVVAVVLLAAHPARAYAAMAAAGLLAVTATRFSGRWSDQWIASYVRYRGRTRAHRPVRALDVVAPNLDTRAYADRAGNRVGLAGDGTGWTAILRLEPIPDEELARRLEGLLAELPATLHSGDIRIASAQLVGWSVPARKRTVRAYWVAIRFDPHLDPQSVQIRGGGEAGATQAAGVAALRLATALRQKGYALRPLDGTELATELAASLGEEPPGRGTGLPVSRPSIRESWRSWSVGALHHTCFRLRRRPASQAALAKVLTWLGHQPAISTCVSVSYPGASVVIRMAVPGRPSAAAVRAYARFLSPMNGDHLDGVRATIPLCRPVP